MKKYGFVLTLLPFWLYVLFFKFGAGLHYSLLSTLGSQVLPVWAVGLAVGSASFLQLVFDVPAGYALDRFGYVRLLRIFTLVFALGTWALFAGLTLVTFFLTLLLSEAGWLFFGPGTSAYVLSSAPVKTAGKFLGFFHTTTSAGIVLASSTLGFVVGWSPRALGILLTALIGTALFAAFLTPKERVSVHAERKSQRHTYHVRRHFLRHVLASITKLNPASTLLMLQNMSGALFYGAVWFVVPLILARQTNNGFLGLSLSVFDLAVVLLGAWFGSLADTHDRKRLVFYGLLLFAIGATLIGFRFDLWFLVFGFLATAGDELSSVSLWAWLDELDVKHDEDGLVNGAIVVAEDLGWTVGPAAAGLLFAFVGPSWTIALCAVPILLTWLFSFLFIRNPLPLGIPGPRWREIPQRPRHKR